MKPLLFKIFFPLWNPVLSFYWFVFRPKTIGVKCVLRYKNQILLIKNSYGLKLWTLPGGGAKHKETPEMAAVREVKEETGISIAHPRNCGSIFYDGEYKRNTIWVFEAIVDSPDFRISNFEVEEATWFTRDALPPKKSDLLTHFLEMTKTTSLR